MSTDRQLPRAGKRSTAALTAASCTLLSSLVALVSAAAGSAAAPAPALPPRLVQALDAKSASLVFVVGDSTILRSRDGGLIWHSYRVPGIRTIAGATFVNASHWLAAAASVGNTTTIPILRTSNAGVRWRSTLLPRRYPDGHGAVDFSFTDAHNGWLTVDTVHSAAFAYVDLYRTSDGGASWRYLGSHPFAGPIRFVGARGWAIGGPASERLYTSGDSGRSWRAMALPVPASLRGEVATVVLPTPLAESGRLLAVAVWYAKQTGVPKTRNTVVIYRSDDGGRRWAPTTPVSDSGFGNYGAGTPIPVALTDVTHWAIAAGIRLYLSSDAGRHWRAIEPDARASGLDGLIGVTQLELPTSRVGFALIQYGHCREFKRECTQRSFVLRSATAGSSWALLGLEGPAAAFPRCHANQLTAAAGFRGATGSALGGATIRNTSHTTCSLPQRPSPRVAQQGRTLTITIRNRVPLAATPFPQVPVRVLRPGASAYALLQWLNWCGTHPSGPAQLTLEIGIGSSRPVIARARDAVIPRCDNPTGRSELYVGNFVEPPQ